jgi:hypothetical protein
MTSQELFKSQNFKEEIQKKWDSLLDSTLLPIAMKVSAKTIGQNLVSTIPLGANNVDELDNIQKEVKSANRDRKIDSIIEGKNYTEMKVEDHPNFKEVVPQGQIFYYDYKYSNFFYSPKIKR